MKKGTDEMHFFYDAQSRPTMVEYNEEKYHYLHNLQGDIVGIIDSNGTKVVEYKYNAWGKLPVSTGNFAEILGCVNPIRYRGYTFDIETGLYYLNSRYYNLLWNRFLNTDIQLNTAGNKIGLNVFAYCRNNPVNRVDYGGSADVAVFQSGNLGQEIWELVKVAWEWCVTRAQYVKSSIPLAATVAMTDTPMIGLGDCVAIGIIVAGAIWGPSIIDWNDDAYILHGVGTAQNYSRHISSSKLYEGVRVGEYRRNGKVLHHIVAWNSRYSYPARVVLKNMELILLVMHGTGQWLTKISTQDSIHLNTIFI